MFKLLIFQSLVAFSYVNCGKITVYRYSFNKGTALDFDLSSNCIPTLGELDMKINSINTHDQCVQLYQEQDCTGSKYLIVRPGTASHFRLDFYGYDDKVRSIGPCFERCHADRIPQVGNNVRSSPSDISVTVEFYGTVRPSENEQPLAIVSLKDPTKCRDITEILQSWTRSVIRARIPTATCVELHEFGDCTGKSTLLTLGPDMTQQWTIQHHGLDTKMKTGSLSFCGYNCNHTIQTLGDLDKEDIEPEDGSVTLFRHLDFAGERTNLVLNGCTSLPEGWNTSTSSPRSIITYGQCVLLYGDEGCGGTEEPLMEAVMGAEPYLFWSNKSLRAIKTCPSVQLKEHYCGSGSGSGGGWVWVIILLMCLVIIVVGTLVIYRRRKGSFSGGNNGMDRDFEEDENSRGWNKL